MDATLTDVLKRTAFFAETHSIKGWLATRRLERRMPRLAPFLSDLGRWNQLLSAPAVDGVLHARVDWDRARIADNRLLRTVRCAVFPLAYVAAVEWSRRHGLASMIAEDRDMALRRIGHLGHSFTIHRSFHDVVQLLETDEQRELCAERYAEFVASQLSEVDAANKAVGPLDGPEVELLSVCDEVLARPGYLGHTLITLGTVLRCRSELEAAHVRYALARVREMAVPSAADAQSLAVARRDVPADEATLEAAIAQLLEHGPREVHTVTLADAALDVWDALPERRVEIEVALLKFAAQKLERTGGGERAPS